jgi:hypothetical protein
MIRTGAVELRGIISYHWHILDRQIRRDGLPQGVVGGVNCYALLAKDKYSSSCPLVMVDITLLIPGFTIIHSFEHHLSPLTTALYGAPTHTTACIGKGLLSLPFHPLAPGRLKPHETKSQTSEFCRHQAGRVPSLMDRGGTKWIATAVTRHSPWSLAMAYSSACPFLSKM